jgi:UDP-N-acetylmuramoylalanine--D-glutamate ligase
MHPYEGRRVLVAGTGVAGAACVEVLLSLGADVTVLDRSETDALVRLKAAGADVVLGEVPPTELLDTLDDLIVSPGFAPHTPVVRAAVTAGVPVYSEPELAWRLRGPSAPAWLAVTGTNGKTTTTTMLSAILRAAGHRTTALGNIGEPLVHAALAPDRYDVLAVELSSFQLHWSPSVVPAAGCVLNVAEDHLDWYDGPHGMAEYAADKGRIYQRAQKACVYNAADPETERLVREADVEPGARAIGFTLGMPAVGMVGVVDDILVDRAFIAERQSSAAELCTIGDLASPAPHVVANALAAAALARAHGVPQAAVRDGLRGFSFDGHRIAVVATVDEVTYVDDSKATNPHAARSSLLAYDPVVWVAGGLAKGARFDDLVAATRDRLRGAVLLGRDRHVIAEALARHAPDVPVISVDADETGTGHAAMERAVGAAADLAQPGDTVLLAPGCASMDMFTDYADRGDAFAAAVRGLTERPG